MIYIDPPYNTGNDFIYPDNFSEPLDNYLRITGQKDDNGNLLTSNTETNGRYHSRWLSMMYPRLFIARQLLRDDGVIFISIDENEVHNLRMLMNEVFGEENFIAEYVWKARAGKTGTIKSVSFQHEYILCFARTNEFALKMKEIRKGKNCREQLRQWGQADRKEDRPSMYFPVIGPDGTEIFPVRDDGTPGRWRCGKKKVEELRAENRLSFEHDGEHWNVYKMFPEGYSTYSAFGTIIEDVGTTSDGTIAVKELFGDKVMDFPKPPSLIKFLCDLNNGEDDAIVMDFFAGSCTLAHSVYLYNRENMKNYKYICVQLPERTDEKSIAFSMGYKTISDIGKERIRKVIAKLKLDKENTLDFHEKDKLEDLGFKVFKLDKSSFMQWDEISRNITNEQEWFEQMQLFLDPLMERWNTEDVIYEIALKQGFSLNIEITRVIHIEESGIYRVYDREKEQSFHICLDDKLSLESYEKLGLKKDDLFVCRDVAIDDTIAANISLQSRFKII